MKQSTRNKTDLAKAGRAPEMQRGLAKLCFMLIYWWTQLGKALLKC